jgi:hypothetical protein
VKFSPLTGIPNFAIEKDGGNGLRETKIRLLRDTTLRVRLSVPKGTPTALAASGTQYLLMVRELEWPPNGTVMWCGPVSELRGNNAVESEETVEMPDLSGTEIISALGA